MLKKIIRAISWAKIARLYHKNQFEDFLLEIDDYEMKEDLNYYERALKYTALLFVEKYEASENGFIQLSRDIKNPQNDEEKYILLYALAKIEDINGRNKNYENHKSQAQNLKVGILYKNIIPV